MAVCPLIVKLNERKRSGKRKIFFILIDWRLKIRIVVILEIIY
jgi:hypothetical protein